MPDYTEQLRQIAAALSRPGMPVWVVAVLSAFLGLVGGLLLRQLEQWLTDLRQRKQLRRILYVDLFRTFDLVERVLSDQSGNTNENLKVHLKLLGDNKLRENLAAYMQLPEYATAESVYTFFHRALDPVTTLGFVVFTNLFSDWAIARQVFAEAVTSGELRRKYFDKFIGKPAAERLTAKCKRIHDDTQRARNELLENMLGFGGEGQVDADVKSNPTPPVRE
jgi:hypothetical protein